jgi:hypothetical protein
VHLTYRKHKTTKKRRGGNREEQRAGGGAGREEQRAGGGAAGWWEEQRAGGGAGREEQRAGGGAGSYDGAMALQRRGFPQLNVLCVPNVWLRRRRMLWCVFVSIGWGALSRL